ncbi:MAG TPA: N-formylglutamate amidohydrolase [Anaerolineae bacterium]
MATKEQNFRTEPIWHQHLADSPLITTAIHNGHTLRSEVAGIMALDEAARLREEDPFTGDWTDIGGTRLIGTHSRFQVDLNRPRAEAVYLEPEQAWGLRVWTEQPTPDLLARSLAEYDAFYAAVHQILAEMSHHYGRFVVFDLHSYNHYREGPTVPPADPTQNPEANVGTGSLNRERWAPVIERFMADLRTFDFLGRRLDVRENIKFFGGQFPRWIHQMFPDSACALAIEFKKFFMDEWTGQPDPAQLEAIRLALQSTVPGVLEELQNL